MGRRPGLAASASAGRVGQALREFAGADRILAEGRRAFEVADYRWAAEILHKLVFADPDNPRRHATAGRCYEQLGYQAEGPQWRGIYFSPAMELREDPSGRCSPRPVLTRSWPCRRHPVRFRCRPGRAETVQRRSADRFRSHDDDETWTIWVRRGVLKARRGASPDAQLTVTGPKAALVGAC